VVAPFYWVRKRLASFFSGFSTTDHADRMNSRKRTAGIFSIPAAPESYQLLSISYQGNVMAEAPVWDAAAVWEPVSESECAWALRLLLALVMLMLMPLLSLLALPLLLASLWV
jgi:hypothetical protein